MRLQHWIGALVAFWVWPLGLEAQSAVEDFNQSCAMCHTIGGGPLAGPDLAGMSERRERSWLIRFIVDPQAVIDSGDAAARAMVDEYMGMVMPPTPGMTPDRAAALVDYVSERTAAEGAQETGAAEPAPAAFSAEDIERGRELFAGDRRLEAGGAPCLACHHIGGLGALGGGALGPDLSKVFERFGGRRGLESWLAAPPTPMMSSLYRTRPISADEILAFTAFFEQRAADEAVLHGTGRGAFLAFGAAGSLLLAGLFHLLWRERFRGVRRKLVHNYRLRGVQ